MKKSNKTIKYLTSLLIIMLFISNQVTGAEKSHENLPKKQAETQELSQPFTELQTSVAGAIEQEQAHLGAVLKKIIDEKEMTDKVEKEISLYKILISSAQNLLIIPGADIDILEKNSEELRLSQTSLEEDLEIIKASDDVNKEQIETTNEKIKVSQNQIESIKKEYGKDKDIKPIIKMIEDLNRVRTDKLKSLKQLDDIYSKQIKILTSVIEPYSDLSSKMEEKLRIREQEVIFERNHNIISQLKPGVILKDLKAIANFSVNIFTKEFWKTKVSRSGENEIYTALFVIAALFLSAFGLSRIRSHLNLESRLPNEIRLTNVKNILTFMDKSFVLVFMTIFLFTYERYREFSGLFAFLNPVQKITASFLILYLFSTSLDIYFKSFKNRTSEILASRKSFLIRILYTYSFLYIMIEWISGSGSTILLISRLVLEVSAVIWFIRIWKKISNKDDGSPESEKMAFNSAKWLGYAITGSGLILEIAGYGYLTIHWYQGWIITATITSVIYFSLLALKEWDDSVKDKEVKAGLSESNQHEKHNTYPIYWLAIRIIAFVILMIGIGSVAYICGARESVFEAAWGLVTEKIEIGGTSFSIANTFLAVFIIILTNVFIRLWRSVMMTKILKNSGIEGGLKDSIITISAYLIWGIGILMSMHAFGLSSASLTVGFGALGIGLGFGLQNIFNNFISGLILLFERPIQTGDVVEINGVLGMVTKINVRSTLVQTYSNASFIIPNSEFISNRVINWSHKDPYIKRDVTVGVAYGTDTEKVRTLLLEAADNVPEILNFPMAPSVSFVNFGDSSLDFKVKFWTTIDDFSLAESKMRFEIERKFRENDINIPFPQREIKILKD